MPYVTDKSTGEAVYYDQNLLDRDIYFDNFDELKAPLEFKGKRVQRCPQPKNTSENRGRKGCVESNIVAYTMLNRFTDSNNDETCRRYKSACYKFPFLEDLLLGASALDTGGDRGLRVDTLFTLMSSLKTITTRSVQERTWMSRSHCKRYAAVLRACKIAFENSLSVMDTSARDIDPEFYENRDQYKKLRVEGRKLGRSSLVCVLSDGTVVHEDSFQHCQALQVKRNWEAALGIMQTEKEIYG